MTAVNDRVIQVTVTNDNSTNYLSAMLVFFSVMLQHDVDVSQVPMRLTTQVDIAQATANGAPDDSTSNRAPTTGKLPPAASGKLDFRAALYGLDEEAPPAAVASTTRRGRSTCRRGTPPASPTQSSTKAKPSTATQRICPESPGREPWR
ncbi:hypothetical protein [Lacticaseibacillus nasuensis]|uniref:hypothetical protein n=1 Tax=Lacticaseibacillus nasuensis TaxID=944671 RepID=UPI0006D1ED68|nr:hypothetical protein [Lacticaseibacillus nasuensis]